MGGLDCIRRFPNAHFHRHLCPLASPPPPSSSPPRKTLLLFSPTSNTQTRTINTKNASAGYKKKGKMKMADDLTLRPPFSLPQNQQTQQQKQQNDDDDKAEEQEEGEDENRAQGCGRGNWTIVLSSSLVGLLTGIGVVLFNYSSFRYIYCWCRMWLGLLTLSKCTSYMLVFVDNLHKNVGLPKILFPIVGGLAIGLMALAYPEILYLGFENVDIFLESRPLEKGLSANQFLQLVVVKIADLFLQQQEWHTAKTSVLQLLSPILRPGNVFFSICILIRL